MPGIWVAVCCVSMGMLLAVPRGSANAMTIEHLSDVPVGNNFVLGPGKEELVLNPGESATRELTVTNRLGRGFDFVIEVEDFMGSDDPDKTTIFLGDETGPYSLRDYLHPDVQRFHLEHGERAHISVRVSIPYDAEPGGRYGAVLVAAVPATPRAGSETGNATGGAKIVTRLGALFFVRVNGDVAEEGHLKNFETIGGKIFSASPIPFQILFENQGSVHLTPYGLIEITNMWGKKVGEIEVDPWFALPDSVRFREVEWDQSFLFGRYVAHAAVNRGYGDVVDEGTTVFWVIPWRAAGLGIFLVVVIAGFLKYVFPKFEIRRKR